MALVDFHIKFRNTGGDGFVYVKTYIVNPNGNNHLAYTYHPLQGKAGEYMFVDLNHFFRMTMNGTYTAKVTAWTQADTDAKVKVIKAKIRVYVFK